jgi:hypothetical protein
MTSELGIPRFFFPLILLQPIRHARCGFQLWSAAASRRFASSLLRQEFVLAGRLPSVVGQAEGVPAGLADEFVTLRLHFDIGGDEEKQRLGRRTPN